MTNHSLHIRAIVWALVAGQIFIASPMTGDPSVVSAIRRTVNRPGTMEPWTWKAPRGSRAAVAQDFLTAVASAKAVSPAGTQIAQSIDPAARPTRARRITPNRTVPHVDPVPHTPVFSASPTDQEIFRARIFPEPLVPVMATSADENHALVQAVRTYNGSRATLAPFEKFLSDFPSSGWRPSLLANLGLVYLQAGRPSKALQSWDAAWQATKHETLPINRAVADYALGHWLQLTAHMGRVPALIERLGEIEGRDVGGPAGSRVRTAREALWVLQNHHELAAGSGPMALNSILRNRAGTDYTPPAALEQYHAVPQGASLTEMQALAGQVGLRVQMAHASTAVRVPVPSMVHLKTDHFTAVLEERGNQYRLRDGIFGGDA